MLATGDQMRIRVTLEPLEHSTRQASVRLCRRHMWLPYHSFTIFCTQTEVIVTMRPDLQLPAGQLLTEQAILAQPAVLQQHPLVLLVCHYDDDIRWLRCNATKCVMGANLELAENSLFHMLCTRKNIPPGNTASRSTPAKRYCADRGTDRGYQLTLYVSLCIYHRFPRTSSLS
jgi:hypothetical protein